MTRGSTFVHRSLVRIWRALAGGAICLGVSICLTSPVQAQADLMAPIEHEIPLTATVPVFSPPPVPILIQPKNNSHEQSGLVEFRWNEVTGHPVNLVSYRLYLNGETLFDLPLGNKETDDYSFVLLDGVYRLKLKKPAKLLDGSYTWKVRVRDANERNSDSATWQFTLDSSHPPIVVTDIQGQQVSISASDPATVPVDPVVVQTSTPFVYGATEPLAEVQLALLRADGSVSHYKMIATDDGHFLFTLPALNPEEIVGLTFTAIDIAGNTRVLHGLRLQYQPRRVVIPLPDFVPDQPDVVIPIPDLPGITEPLPPVLAPDSPVRPGPFSPGEQVFARPITPLTTWRWVLLLILFGYTWWVYLWTGNRWYRYVSWLPQLLRWWLLLPDGESLVTTRKGVGVPWIPLKVEWLEQGSKYRSKTVWSSATGSWAVPTRFPALATLAITHQHWQWLPVSEAVVASAGYTPINSLTLVRPETGGAQKSTATSVSLQSRVWLVVVSADASVWRWRLRWWPRFWLVMMLLVAGWLAYRVPVAETFLWCSLVIWVLVRDVQGKLPERWKAWQESV